MVPSDDGLLLSRHYMYIQPEYKDNLSRYEREHNEHINDARRTFLRARLLRNFGNKQRT